LYDKLLLEVNNQRLGKRGKINLKPATGPPWQAWQGPDRLHEISMSLSESGPRGGFAKDNLGNRWNLFVAVAPGTVAPVYRFV
jgi:hypothetical protein